MDYGLSWLTSPKIGTVFEATSLIANTFHHSGHTTCAGSLITDYGRGEEIVLLGPRVNGLILGVIESNRDLQGKMLSM